MQKKSVYRVEINELNNEITIESQNESVSKFSILISCILTFFVIVILWLGFITRPNNTNYSLFEENMLLFHIVSLAISIAITMTYKEETKRDWIITYNKSMAIFFLLITQLLFLRTSFLM